jgi:hypothetical protein
MHLYLCRLLEVDSYAPEIDYGVVSMQNYHMNLNAISVSSQYYNAIPTRLSFIYIGHCKQCPNIISLFLSAFYVYCIGYIVAR